jgi:7-cyano-7-deazaguanine synthase in queuosine biosynthesis
VVRTNWIWCGPDGPTGKPPDGSRPIRLSTFPDLENVHLKLENISKVISKDIPSLLLDMLEVGSYVYSADQAVSRGGKTLPHEGRDWRRDFRFEIPVRNPDIWNSEEVGKLLRSTLSFLSDDFYEFHFRQLCKDVPIQQYFDFDEGRPWFEADEVMLFSGGLDSFTGLCQATIENSRRVVLVSHRPAPQLCKRQLKLLEEFRSVTDHQYRVLHVPVWVNKGERLTRDTSQRSRSFLYVMLAAVVAEVHGLNQVSFYENGYVSFNLPISEQLQGARASRSTHPKVIHGFADLLGALLQKDFRVANPFIWKTRAEVVQTLCDLGMKELIGSTNSCAHVRTGEPINTHCGVCSQCIDRRFAVQFCQVAEFDPISSYKTLLPLDPLTDTESRTMVESYLRFAKDMTRIGIDGFYAKYGQTHNILRHLGLTTGEAAKKLFELHERHGRQVCSVLETQIREHARPIANGTVNPDSMLAMVIGQPKSRSKKKPVVARFPSLPDLSWKAITIEMVSVDSVRIRVGSFSRTYTGYAMGFCDNRKKNALNKQWDLLWQFADGEGKLNWSNPRAMGGAYKRVNLLRQTLKVFFGLEDNPISDYERDTGYVAHFKIVDPSKKQP